MKYRFLRSALLTFFTLCLATALQAQNYSLKIKLVDKDSGEPVGYATVAVTPDGKTDVLKYSQSDDAGLAEIKGIPAGKYKVSAMLMGYDNYEEVVDIRKDTDLGTKTMAVQANFLKGATVTDYIDGAAVKATVVERCMERLLHQELDLLLRLSMT